MSEEEVTVSIVLEADVVMDLKEVWPDGDIPEVVTAETVKAALLDCGHSKVQVLRDWCLLDALRVTAVVDTQPKKGPRTTESVEVWSEEGS